MSELTEALGASQQNVSKHLAVLSRRRHRSAAARRETTSTTASSTRASSRSARESAAPLQRAACRSLQRARRSGAQCGSRDQPSRRARSPRRASAVAAAASTRKLSGRSAGSAAGPPTTSAPSRSPGSSSRSGSASSRRRSRPALSGAGWQANGSESVQARQLIQSNFAGLSSSALMVVVHSPTQTATDPAFRATVVARRASCCGRARQVASVVSAPRRGRRSPRDGHTAIVMAGAKGDPTAMVAAADTLKGEAAGGRHASASASRSPARPGCGATSTPRTARR